MRGLLFLIITSLLVAGCFEQPDEINQTITNISNNTTDNQSIVCLGPVCGADERTYATDCEAIDAGIAILHTGECEIEENCTDTDGGIVLGTRGTASKGTEIHEDYCVDLQQLIEYTCLDNSIEMATVNCGQGKECIDGECIEIELEPEVIGCEGTSDVDIYNKDSITLNGNITYTDVCIEYGTVKDYYCENDEMKSTNTQCPSGYACNNGKCEPLTNECTDSDGGANIFERGRTKVTRGLMSTIFDQWDECVDFGMIKEHSCLENETAKTEDIECGSGYKCSTGRCVQSACSDTDGGLEIYVAGTVTKNGNEYEDYCFDDYELREYYCYGDDVELKKHICPEDYICLNKKCVVGSIS
ncbi:hypothetical protein KKB44_01175 [Candidatus Micrarchaeota archaeon]|nr:hypothetical protein [Candidatus Micrarchaeota archaeon]